MISIIIVNYNGKRFLENCLDSLARQTFAGAEILLVDNGSSDGSGDYVRKHFPSIILLPMTENLGFAGGVNAGIIKSSGEFIVTLNNDTVADPLMLEELVQPMMADPRIGMCGAKMVYPDGRINSTALCISRSGAAWDRGKGEEDRGQWDAKEPVFGPCAGAALYRRSMLEEIGLFDEELFLFMEDVDLAFRAQLAGWRCMYVPTAKVTHIHGGTAGTGTGTAVYYGNRNRLLYILKDFPVSMILWSSPWIIGRTCIAIPYHIIKGNGGPVLRAVFDVFRKAGIFLKKRDSVRRKTGDTEIYRWILTWSDSAGQRP